MKVRIVQRTSLFKNKTIFAIQNKHFLFRWWVDVVVDCGYYTARCVYDDRKDAREYVQFRQDWAEVSIWDNGSEG